MENFKIAILHWQFFDETILRIFRWRNEKIGHLEKNLKRIKKMFVFI